MKAVIIEDEVVVARDLADMLEEVGYTVPATATTAEKGLEAIGRHHPDVALIDIVLRGDTDGIALAHTLREKHHIPFLFITAHADRATVERAKAAHPDGYLVKPFSKDDVYAATEVALINYAEGQFEEATEPARKARQSEVGSLPAFRLRKVKNYIRDHLDENLTLAQLAEVAGMSKYYFSRMFKEAVGKPPYQYVVQQRMNEAKRLLREKDVRVAQVALRTGFNSHSHFSRVFKRHTGHSPTTYRADR